MKRRNGMSVILAHATRNKLIENIYRGDAVVVNLRNERLYELGDIYKSTYWRSAAKPFQALPFVEAGGIEKYRINDRELALMTASHGGEPQHTVAVEGLLDKIGFSSTDLRCGSAPPMYHPAYKQLLRDHQPWSELHNCCSGKHSCMLALTAVKQYTAEHYDSLDHPVQQDLLKVVAEICEMETKNIGIGTDGCGVPIYYLPLLNMAKAYAVLSNPVQIDNERRQIALHRIAKAMTSHPYFVAGTKRLDTILMEVTGGRLLAKLGADGVYCVSVMDEGIGIALKIECGEIRVIEPVIVELLRKLQYINDLEHNELQQLLDFNIYNHRREIIGTLEAVF
jgi:L-asparaginase II